MGSIPPSVLCQPPPPPPRRHRNDGSLISGAMDPHLNSLHTLMTNKEEGNTVMIGSNCTTLNCTTRPYYFRRCKRMILTNIEFLPDELLFEILLHLPAQDIYYPARLVCRRWYQMIHTHRFIYAHLQHTTWGLLIQYNSGKRDQVFVYSKQGRIEISKFGAEFKCRVWASCNGLVLGHARENRCSLYIKNPATKQHFALPPFFHRILRVDFSGIAYAAASMEYKVVLTHVPDDTYNVHYYVILTVGVDNSWRQLSTQHLSPTAKKPLSVRPLMTEGFMHWAKGTQVLTLNAETEIITETPAPLPRVYEGRKIYMSTGRYVSLLIACGKLLWEVWEMTPVSGEWTRLPNIDLEAQKCMIERLGCLDGLILSPAGWLEYTEVLIFRICKLAAPCIFYNLHTHEIGSMLKPSVGLFYGFAAHRNSLVWLGGS